MRFAAALLIVVLVAGASFASEDPAALDAAAAEKRQEGDLWTALDLARRASEAAPTAERLTEVGTIGLEVVRDLVARGEAAAPGGGATVRTLLLDATRALDRSLEIRETVRARVSRGLVLLYLGESRGAWLELERAVEIGPRDPLALREAAREALRRKDTARAIEFAERLVEVRPTEAEGQLLLGKARYHGGAADQAGEPLVQALLLDPELAEALAYLRGLYLNRGLHVEMARSLRAVLDRHPDQPAILRNLGYTLTEKGESEEAAATFRQVLGLPGMGDDLESACWLAWLYAFRLDRREEGLRVFGRVLSRDPTHAKAVESMHYLVRRSILEGDPERTRLVLQVWCEADPQNASAWANLGSALRQLGRYSDAIRAYERAREEDPFQAWIVSDQGLVEMARGRLDAAVACFRDALEIDGEFLDALENLGIVARLRGRTDEARKWFARAWSVARELDLPSVGKYRRYVDLVVGRDRRGPLSALR
jgi:tetratricopeptide (TPR) repeat protein